MNPTTSVQIVLETIKAMAKIIPGEILDAALKEVAGFPAAEARAEIDRIASVQPALVEYFRTMTGDYSENVQSFGSAMFIAIHRVFDKQFGSLQKVGTKRVEQIADRNEQAMMYLRMRQPEEEGFVSAAMAPSLSQPGLLNYVFESIGTPKPNVPKLSVFEQDCFAVILKTVIDVLDSAV